MFMSYFHFLRVALVATYLLAVGPAARLVAAEQDGFGAADLPEVNPRPLSPGSVGTPTRAELSPVVAPVAPEVKAAKPGVFARVVPAIVRLLTFKRGDSQAGETPAIVQAPPQVVAERTSAQPAQVSAWAAPTPMLSAAPEAAPAPAVSASRFNWFKRKGETADSVPALVAAALPDLRAEPRRSRAPNLPRQLRLDMDQRIERLGPELEPVAGSNVLSGVSLAAGPTVAAIEETVITLEAAATAQTQAGGGISVGGMVGQVTRRSDEVRLIPDDAKQFERFREVSVFFDPPSPRLSSPAETPKSSATYEKK
jgi:hypothetical protein